MDYGNIPLFNLMKSKLNYHSARQSVLAQNIANADTPDYKARDVAAPDFAAMVAARTGHKMQVSDAQDSRHASRMRVTHAGHLSGDGGGNPAMAVTLRKHTFELNPNGNNVSVEEEMAEVAKNQAEYVKVLNLYSKTVSLFKTALGNPSGG